MKHQEISIDWHEVQSLLYHGYPRFPLTRYILVEFSNNDEEVKSWLATVYPIITYAPVPALNVECILPAKAKNRRSVKLKQEKTEADAQLVNVAFTATGLLKAGLTESDLDTFSYEFKEGMHSDRASNILGDTDQNSPVNWKWGRQDKPMDAVIIVYHHDASLLEKLLLSISSDLARYNHCAHFSVQAGLEEKGAFELTDGISNPAIKGNPSQPPARYSDPVSLVNPGEFLCGYLNERKQLSPCPSVRQSSSASDCLQPSRSQSMAMGQKKADRYAFGLNGSYLVLRQLKQNTDGFKDNVNRIYESSEELVQMVAQNLCTRDQAEDFIKAKLLGRWPDGTALVDAPTIQSKKELKQNRGAAQVRNDFGYRAEDSRGYKCPIGSHIRRANPRDALGSSAEVSRKLVNRRRILRRGRVYYSDEGQTRRKEGIMFLCFNAHIGKQFEFVQGNWLNDRKFAGPVPEVDPIIGVQCSTAGEFSVQQEPVRRTYKGLTQLVDVLGGGYFFLPGRSAINYLLESTGD